MSLSLILIAASLLLAAFTDAPIHAATPATAESPAAAEEQGHGHGYSDRNHDLHLSISTGDGVLRDCSDLRVTFGRRQHASAEETFNFPTSSKLKVRASRHGGVHLVGSSESDVRVDVCKYAVTEDGSPAEAALKSIVIKRQGSELSASGSSKRPEDEEGDRVVFFIVHAPRGASLDIEATNGPLSVRSFDGTAVLRAENGPISLLDSRGTLDATTTNGPISVSGSSGAIRARATNGPLNVKLGGLVWTGSGLDASTKNGPIHLILPNDFNSGVEVSSAGRSPVRCRAAACREVMTKYEDDSTAMNFGRGATLVKLSTINGPISVKDETSSR